MYTRGERIEWNLIVFVLTFGHPEKTIIDSFRNPSLDIARCDALFPREHDNSNAIIERPDRTAPIAQAVVRDYNGELEVGRAKKNTYIIGTHTRRLALRNTNYKAYLFIYFFFFFLI